MSKENVDVVRRVWEIAQSASDVGAAFDECVREGLLAHDYQWRGGPRGGRAIAGIENAEGREEYVEMMGRLAEGFEDVRIEVERIIRRGERSCCRHHAGVRDRRAKRGAGRVAQRTRSLARRGLHRADGRVLDPADALDAVGLRE
jgi:hypothetical protein